jgi:hypothetical protein
MVVPRCYFDCGIRPVADLRTHVVKHLPQPHWNLQPRNAEILLRMPRFPGPPPSLIEHSTVNIMKEVGIERVAAAA